MPPEVILTRLTSISGGLRVLILLSGGTSSLVPGLMIGEVPSVFHSTVFSSFTALLTLVCGHSLFPHSPHPQQFVSLWRVEIKSDSFLCPHFQDYYSQGLIWQLLADPCWRNK